MFVAVRRYKIRLDAVDDVTRHVQAGYVPIVSQVPGFVEYYWVNAGNGLLVSVGVFADQAAAETSTRLAADYVREHLAALVRNPPEVLEGEVLLHTVAQLPPRSPRSSPAADTAAPGAAPVERMRSAEQSLRPSNTPPGADRQQDRLVPTLERLLAPQATGINDILDQTSQLVAETLHADKVDAFLYHPEVDTLIALGVSHTPLARHQRARGLDRQPLANGGRAVSVFQTGTPYRTGHADQDPEELLGIKHGLGIRSMLAVPLEVDRQRRGVLVVASTLPDQFSLEDLRLLEAVARWVGLVLQRAEQPHRTTAAELVTILAHDLRGPLTSLHGRLELIRARAAREQRQRDVQDVAAAQQVLDRLQQLTADLLDTAQLEQGTFALAPEFIDLAALARESAATARAPTFDIQVQAPDELPVEADPRRMRQALAHLLRNARQHAPDGGGVRLEVSTEPGTAGMWAVLTVHDSGPGIAPDLLPRLFTPFAVGPGTPGLGLGLYLARGIAEAHGGTLTVDSTPGSGTSVRLAFPLGQAFDGAPERSGRRR